MFKLFDTKEQMVLRPRYSTLKLARRYREKMDMEYGACRYIIVDEFISSAKNYVPDCPFRKPTCRF